MSLKTVFFDPVILCAELLERYIRSDLTELVFLILLALLIWRIWKFTLHPILSPDQPKEYPYWIPWHAKAFFQDSNGLITEARRYLGHDGNQPFALTVLGTTFYIATQAKHSAQVYKNTETLSFESFVQTLMKANGNDDDVINAMYSALPVDKRGFPNPQGESLGVLAQKMHIHQLYPSENLVALQHQVKTWIDSYLDIDFLKAECSHGYSKNSHIELPLYQWCSNAFVRMGQHVYFGETLDNIDPGLPSAFLEFDERIWKMLYQYPGFLSRDMSVPRTRVITSLRQYFQVPRKERVGKVAWLIDAMEDEMRALGIDDENLAILMFHLYFAINTNTRKTVFWMLAYLLHNPQLLDAYRQETEAAFSGGHLVDPLLLQNVEKCPQVDAIWNETLRLSGWSASVRLITEDTIIGGKLMRKGNRVLVPHRLLHFDGNTFGEDAHDFRPERWKKPLTRNASWRPFGGGKTTCSGRFLARFSVTTFVATLLRRFDVEMKGNPPFPEADEGRPVLGIMSIKKGSDFKVELQPRVEFSGK
ncbi:putative cytochrome p450 [Polyplosphaeria fusca]|uniref:Cytochrome p450 n=1 Tax=Polyplosphaeria fusca TaxID=682080 RepID=A0A9P4QQQ6_9PLEO|nr:putative cytochrome p450 [Polyplosphaeria fusca]